MNKHFVEQTVIFFSVSKWLLLSSAIGIMIGALITLFLKILLLSEHARSLLPFPFLLYAAFCAHALALDSAYL